MTSFRSLRLPDLKLGLADLLDNRHQALMSTKAGQSYQAMLAQKRATLDALPGALEGGRPYAAELAETDGTHDGFGLALWHLTEAYLNIPDAPVEIVAAARRIRTAFIPKLDELGDSYASEADRAQQRRIDQDALKADLKLFPVASGKTLEHWVDSYLSAGEHLDVLLAQRAEKDTGERKDAGKIRIATIGLLTRLRTALADELDHDPELPRNLETQVFAYFEQLAKMRTGGGAPSSEKEPPPPATPPAGGTP